jgi:transcriptional antiterminator Rof (Rho-off)
VLRVELADLTVDDAVDHLLRLALGQRLLAQQRALTLDLRGVEVLAAHAARAHRRDLHRHVGAELLEVRVLGDEVRLAVDLEQHADAAVAVHVRGDHALGG